MPEFEILLHYQGAFPSSMTSAHWQGAFPSSMTTSTVSLERVREQARALTASRCRFILGTDSKPFRGGECCIFALESEEKTKVGIRIPYAIWFTPEKVREEVNFRKSIEEKRISGVQRLIGFDDTYENKLGSPWIAFIWVDGSSLQWNAISPPDHTSREGIIREIARVNVDLLKIDKPGCTAREWMSAKISRKIERVRAGSLLGMTVQECEHQRDLLDRYLPLEPEIITHVLVHGDLCGNNIIVGENFEFRCVIDLGQAEMVPLLLAAAYPPFLTHDPTQGAEGINWAIRDTEDMQLERAFYLKCVQDLAKARGGLVQHYYKALARQDEVDKYWWFVAASSKDIHRAMAACDWKPPIMHI